MGINPYSVECMEALITDMLMSHIVWMLMLGSLMGINGIYWDKFGGLMGE